MKDIYCSIKNRKYNENILLALLCLIVTLHLNAQISTEEEFPAGVSL